MLLMSLLTSLNPAPCCGVYVSVCVFLVSRCRCVCIPGWVGPDCSIDYNECVDHHCQNGAQCVDHLDGYSCVCPQGYRYWKQGILGTLRLL